ncbi:hypothetical protein ACP4OV_029576 [Aristida adscensionis]
MGNCLDRPHGARVVAVGGGGGAHCARRSAVWFEEVVVERAEKVKEPSKGESAPAPAVGTEVKIRITKKQLEELLRRVEDGKDAGGVPVREVISELLCMASSSSNFRHRGDEDAGQWRPSLQSIPE